MAILTDAKLPDGAVSISGSVHHSTQIVCPHCAHEQGELWRSNRLDDGWKAAQCIACGKPYAFRFSLFLTCVSDQDVSLVKAPRLAHSSD